jgi:hypothetical protein
MKSGIFWAVAATLVVLAAGRCGAGPINVLSTEYHVYAQFAGYGYFDYTASFPQGQELRLDIGAGGPYTDPWISAGAHSGEWSPEVYGLGASVEGQRGWIGYDPAVFYPDDNRIPGPEGSGGAEATVTFMPYGNILQVQYDWYVDGLGSLNGDAGILLQDVTAGVPLPPGFNSGNIYSWLQEYEVDPSHMYRVKVWTEMEASMEWFFVVSNGVLKSYTVPAPGAVVLGVIGAGLIGLLRQRKMM